LDITSPFASNISEFCCFWIISTLPDAASPEDPSVVQLHTIE
jgi:hypothetical protein